MNTIEEILLQFKSEWRMACQNPYDVQHEQDEVLEKYKVYVDNDPELGDLIEEFINITR